MILLVELKRFIILWDTEKLRWVVPGEKNIEYVEKTVHEHETDVTNLSGREIYWRLRLPQGMPETWMCDCKLVTKRFEIAESHNITKSQQEIVGLLFRGNRFVQQNNEVVECE